MNTGYQELTINHVTIKPSAVLINVSTTGGETYEFVVTKKYYVTLFQNIKHHFFAKSGVMTLKEIADGITGTTSNWFVHGQHYGDKVYLTLRTKAPWNPEDYSLHYYDEEWFGTQGYTRTSPVSHLRTPIKAQAYIKARIKRREAQAKG